MTTNWKSNNEKLSAQKSANHTPKNTISGATLSSWSRQQKFAMLAGFAILAVLLAASSCSKQSPKPALVGVSSPVSAPATPPAFETSANLATAVPPTAPAKKTAAKRPANVTYSDANSGVSFLYPRKAMLTSGDKPQPEHPAVSDVPMNFVQPGGVVVATVTLRPTAPIPAPISHPRSSM